MRKIRYLSGKLLIGASLLSLSACSHSVELSSSHAPAAEVMPNRIIKTPTQYSFTEDLANGAREIQPESTACSAHSYKIGVGPAIAETIRNINNQAFTNATEIKSHETATAPYNMRVDLEDISAHIMVVPQFFTSRIEAHIEIDGRVEVKDQQGATVIRTMVSGEGTESADGDCFNAEKAIHLAGDKAIRRFGTDYVYKVINSNVLH